MRDRRWAVALAVLASAVLGIGPVSPAWAQSVTGAQLQDLAARAAGDARALAQLRAVREVDGRPVDMGRALAGAEGPGLAARLQALRGGAPAGSVVESEQARREARDVLDGRRFKPARVPRPFAGILRTLGRWLEPVGEPIGRLWRRVVDTVAGRLVLVGLVFAVAALISARLIGRRSPGNVHRSRPFGMAGESLDPDDLERQAVAAERAGDLDHAVRLRFVAGVLRLDRAGVIAYRSSLTTGQLRSRLPSASFAELAAAFDEIAYGGRPAEEADLRAATEGWPRVLAEAGPGGRPKVEAGPGGRPKVEAGPGGRPKMEARR
ncbi:MAG TPA: DUF4129 domain-containing protein [Acidimicrobiales bacterium]|nr:DUF4129 domain-containing protein [Acidimicrobiales bacterium]